LAISYPGRGVRMGQEDYEFLLFTQKQYREHMGDEYTKLPRRVSWFPGWAPKHKLRFCPGQNPVQNIYVLCNLVPFNLSSSDPY
jgi:hypothetical protein